MKDGLGFVGEREEELELGLAEWENLRQKGDQENASFHASRDKVKVFF